MLERGVVDDVGSEFLDGAFWAGLHSSVAGTLMAALAWAVPQLHRKGKLELPRMVQARTAMSRRAPGQTKLPLPEAIVAALVSDVCWQLRSRGRSLDTGVGLWLAFHAYLRPGELLRLKWRWVTPPAQPRGNACLVLHPTEEEVVSKNGSWDDTVIVDCPELAAILGVLRRGRPLTQPVVDVEAGELAELWNSAQKRVGTDAPLGLQYLYVLRHSGASADVWEKRRSLGAVQARGRWKAHVSVRRYAKGGRVAERWAACSGDLQHFALASKSTLMQVLAGSRAPLRPPWHLRSAPASASSSSRGRRGSRAPLRDLVGCR
jgi:hypothetical protein